MRGLRGRGNRGTRAKREPGRQSSYHNAHPLPSVNQMYVAGGQGYDCGTVSYVPIGLTPTSVSSRIQTPIVRVGAFLRLSTDSIPGDRGRRWCQ